MSIFDLPTENQFSLMLHYWEEFMRAEHDRNLSLSSYKHLTVGTNGKKYFQIFLSVSDIDFMNKEVIIRIPFLSEQLHVETEKAADVNGYYVSLRFIGSQEAERHLRKLRKMGWTQTNKKAA
jgi:hypothetical protein